jgi:hypothetical protein
VRAVSTITSTAMKKSTGAGGTSDWPAGVARPAIRALNGAGYTNLAHLTRAKETELADLHGMGPRALEALRRALREKGLSFAS